MKAYNIVDDRIMLRDHQGDLFEFRLIREGPQPGLRLIGLPSWRSGTVPKNAETRIDFARMAAKEIARQNKLLA